MFEILHVKLFDGQEYKIEGNAKEAELLWRSPPSKNWEMMWFKKLDEGGIEKCVAHLCEELVDLVNEKRAKQRMDDFIIQAVKECEKVDPSSSW